MISRRRSRGMAMIMAAAAVMMVSVLAVAVTAIAVAAGKADWRAALDERLFNRTESGAEAAVDALAAGRPWPGAKTVAVPGGNSTVSARELGAGRWEITAASAEAGRECRLRLVAEPAGTGKLRVSAWRAEAGRASGVQRPASNDGPRR